MNDTLILDHVVRVLAAYDAISRGLKPEHVSKMLGAIKGLRECHDNLQEFLDGMWCQP